jgi:hypothetical protein
VPAAPLITNKQTSGEGPSVARRDLMLAASALLASLPSLAQPAAAAAAGNDAVTAGLKRYVRKKKLDAIDSYLAPLLNAKDQLVRVGRVMLQDPAAARQLLRSGAFTGLRSSARAMGEYAARERGQQAGAELVTNFLGSLEALDVALLQASRGGEPVGDAATQKLVACRAALDVLLAAAPADALEKAGKVAAAAAADVDGEVGDGGEIDEAELVRLQKLL